jgi:hypothetical protein
MTMHSCGSAASAPGQRWGNWTLVAYESRSRWLAKCVCGTEKSVAIAHVRSGKCHSCGCLPRRGKTPTKYDPDRTTREIPEYEVWSSMLKRCYTPSSSHYDEYGGRGITVCTEWCDSFEAFLAYVGRRPSAAHSIDRIEVNGHYEPGNVRWATKVQQMRNTRRTHWITHEGKRLSMAEWAERVGLPAHVIKLRLRRGWSVRDALFKPLRVW